jgi:hypothetical protein
VRLGRGKFATAEFVRTYARADRRRHVGRPVQARDGAGRAALGRELTLEFCGKARGVAGVEIERADDVTTVFLAGASNRGRPGPRAVGRLGQWLPQFFGLRVAIANYARAAARSRVFKADRRWAQLISQVSPAVTCSSGSATTT